MANEKHQIDVELEEAVAQGTYANLAIISHSTSEFVLDFAAVLPGVPKAKVKSRIILAPEHAKRLLLSLQENIARYEANVGRINIPQSGAVFSHGGSRSAYRHPTRATETGRFTPSYRNFRYLA